LWEINTDRIKTCKTQFYPARGNKREKQSEREEVNLWRVSTLAFYMLKWGWRAEDRYRSQGDQ